MKIGEWTKLPVSLRELCVATTLRCGQSFRWKQYDDKWICTLRGRIVQITQNKDHLQYRAIWPSDSSRDCTKTEDDLAVVVDDTGDLLRHYLNLGPNLTELYQQWSDADKNFKKRAPQFTGIRILRQDAWEALVGFICSSNNNIIRISQMVEKICIKYGRFIAQLDGQDYYDFPTPEALTDETVERQLRDMGFGYRAKYIAKTAQMVVTDREPGWLDRLRNPESPLYGHASHFAGEMKPEGRDGYREAHEQLLSLQGVGPKVADCVCLMGLGWGEAVPVDTHVWQIAQRDYRFGRGKHSSLTKATYDAVGNHFRNLWGKEAGWAHSVLFAADLRVFADRAVNLVSQDNEVKKSDMKDEESEVSLSILAIPERFVDVATKPPSDVNEQEKVKRSLEIDHAADTSKKRIKRSRRK